MVSKKIKTVFLTEHVLMDIAKNIASVYPFTAEQIYKVMLQTKSLDVTLAIVHNCTQEAQTLDYGVYCHLKYLDTMYERK